jgi:hypothetical protein
MVRKLKSQGIKLEPKTDVERWDKFVLKLSQSTNPGICQHNYRVTRILLQELPGIDVKKSIRSFERLGGHCDCEVVTNALRRLERKHSGKCFNCFFSMISREEADPNCQQCSPGICSRSNMDLHHRSDQPEDEKKWHTEHLLPYVKKGLILWGYCPSCSYPLFTTPDQTHKELPSVCDCCVDSPHPKDEEFVVERTDHNGDFEPGNVMWGEARDPNPPDSEEDGERVNVARELCACSICGRTNDEILAPVTKL